MTKEEAIKILRREIECLSHTKCEDCILEAACDPIKTTPYDSEYIEVYEMAISALSENKGEWINAKVGKLFPSNDYKCSVCGNILNFDGVNCGRGDANYCPNYGADMRGE